MSQILTFLRDKTALLMAVIAAAIVGGVTSAAVMAAIPDSSGVIHGCYDNKTGDLNVIDTSAGGSCTSKQTSLNWDQYDATVVSNRIQTASGTSGQTILTIPDFGTLQALQCNDSESQSDFEFINTTSNTIDFSPGQAFVILGAGSVKLAPGASFQWTLANYGSTISGSDSFIAGYTSGSSNLVATAQILAVNSLGGGTGCTFDAQAVVK